MYCLGGVKYCKWQMLASLNRSSAQWEKFRRPRQTRWVSATELMEDGRGTVSELKKEDLFTNGSYPCHFMVAMVHVVPGYMVYLGML